MSTERSEDIRYNRRNDYSPKTDSDYSEDKDNTDEYLDKNESNDDSVLVDTAVI